MKKKTCTEAWPGRTILVFLATVWMSLISNGLLVAQTPSAVPTPTPTLIPSPTPICLPCLAEVHIQGVEFQEITAGCTDFDGEPDAGEIFALHVAGSSHNACCTGPAVGLRVDVSTDYPHIEYIGRSTADFGMFYFYVKPTASCGDTAVLFANAYISEGMADPNYKEDHEVITLILENDLDSTGNPVCDSTDCQNLQVLQPRELQAEAYTTGSGVSRGTTAVTFLQTEAWLRFAAVNWGPRFDAQWYYQRSLINYAAEGTSSAGIVEWRLDSLDGPVIATLNLRGTGSASSYNELGAAIQFSQAYELAEDIRDLYLVFHLNHLDVQLDRINLVPSEPAPFDPWYPTPTPTLTPSPTPTPAPLIEFEVVSRIDTFGGLQYLDLQGDYAYILENHLNYPEEHGLNIVNIADPTAPIITGSVNTPGHAYDVKVLGDFAYIADFNTGLTIVDVSNKAAPQIIAQFTEADSAFTLDAAGDYVYMADDYEGLSIIDVSDPYAPTAVGHYATVGDCRDVVVTGNYACIADRISSGNPDNVGVRILDISDKTAPVLVSNLYGFKWPDYLSVDGGYLYVPDTSSLGPAGIQIYNISQPANPVQMSVYAEYGPQTFSFADGNYLFTTSSDGVHAFDVRDKTNPAILGTFELNSARGIYYREDYLYMLEFYNGFTIARVIDNRYPDNQAGDVNGDGSINIIDALMIAQYYVGIPVTGFNPDLADVDGDGTIGIVDALKVAQYYVGLISGF